ncbi:unnamed protein product [Symbiodinium necroappetens]|uniref:Uncharacterized protein n=1 Tax=Symbiodinium necroappetens TaxID=1628268 RepID=A0A813C108_9DINO|nr:unnamed protein product [Symbiodinium necroappetens]
MSEVVNAAAHYPSPEGSEHSWAVAGPDEDLNFGPLMAQQDSEGQDDWHSMNARLVAMRTLQYKYPWEHSSRSTFEARRLLAARFAKTDDQMLLAAFKKVRSIVLFHPEDSALGRSLVAMAGLFVEEAVLSRSIEDAFAGKAPGTLLKRASDFSRFAVWAVRNRIRPLAPSEPQVYEYVSFLRHSGASATSADSFIKAMKFFMHHTGAYLKSPVSARVSGVASSMELKKRPLWQAPPLPVTHVRALEEFVVDTEDHARATIAGFLLFCIYSSSRFSDAARASGISIDESGGAVVILETGTMHYKTRAKDRQNRMLPRGSLTTHASCPRLRLRPRGSSDLCDLEAFTSHSLKATALSWSAKSGTMTYEEMLTQGHHVHPKLGMALLYSRDAMAEIMVKVGRIIRAIVSGGFSPDLPRAQRVALALQRAPEDFAHLPETQPDLVEGEDEARESECEGSDISDSELLKGLQALNLPPAPDAVRPRIEATFAGNVFTSSQGWCTVRLRQGDSSVGGVLPLTCVPCLRVKLRFMFANSAPLRIAVPESDRKPVLFKKEAALLSVFGRYSIDFGVWNWLLFSDWVETAGLADQTFHLERWVQRSLKFSSCARCMIDRPGLAYCGMAGLESSAHFKDRARKYGLGGDLITEFTDAGIDTFGKLAFICAIQPNSGEDAALLEAIKGLTGKDVPPKDIPTVRRLWYESHTHAMLDLQQQVQKTPDSQPREMPMAERLTRLKRQRDELKGLVLDVRTEPGHALVDKVQSMLDQGLISHIPPEKCVSRQDEIMGVKSESRLSLGSDGNIKMTHQASDLRCDTSGELRLRQCFLRRALAFDQVGLASFVQLEEWSNKMFQALLESPPAGYRYVTIQQILSADAKLWQIMSQESRGNIVVGVGLDPPLDSLLKKLCLDPLVIACMTEVARKRNQPPKKTGKGKNGKGKQGEGSSPAGVSLKELLANLPVNCKAKNAEGHFICPFYNKGICRMKRGGRWPLSQFPALPASKQRLPVSPPRFFSFLIFCQGGLEEGLPPFSQEHVDSQNACLPNVVGPVSFCAREHEHSTSAAQGRFPLPTKEALRCDSIQEPLELFSQPACNSSPAIAQAPQVATDGDGEKAPWLVEVCAGSAVLSATALRAGWNALPIDQPSCRFHAHTPLFIMDMRQSSSSVLLASLASRANVAWYHFGLPCGTCSRARERPLPNAPLPLHDADNLFGKAGLRPAEQEQVTAANQVYEQAVEVLFLAYSRGALVTIENPLRSWLWPLLAVLVKRRGPASFRQWYFSLQDYDFDSCMFGSGRAKATRIKGLGHSWQFKTKDEAELDNGERKSLERRPGWSRCRLIVIISQVSCPGKRGDPISSSCSGKLGDPVSSSCSGKRSDPGGQPCNTKRLAGGSSDLVGVFHTMEQHIQLASELAAPSEWAHQVPDAVRRNIFRLCTEGPLAVSKARLQALNHLNARLKELEPQEAELRGGMHPDVEEVTRGKAICLFRELLEETGFGDMSVVDSLISGVDLGGVEPPCALFPERHRPMQIHPDQLDAQEIEAGYLLGPFSSVEEVSKFLGCQCWSLSPRFLLRQGEDGKVRVIDDFSASAVNQSFESHSHLVLQDTDFTVGLLRFLSRVLLNKVEVVVPLSDGQVLRGAWSREMLQSPPLLAKTIDLKKAYKQMAVRPSAWRHAVLGYPDKKDGWTFAISRSLPFGATSSVYAFNKLALALLHIMVVKFHAIATDFYDDYTVFEFQPVVTLGVVLHLEEIWNGRITIANKPGRISKICTMLAPIAEGKPATRSHFMGCLILLVFSKALARGRTTGVELRAAALLAMDVLKGARPRTLVARLTPPMVLYTDGAYENEVATWGAILLDPLSGARWMFHGTVCRTLCDHWRTHAGEQIICEVEAFAVALVLYGLRGSLRGRCIVSFIDNDAARFGFIRRSSPSQCMFNIICIVTVLEAILETSLWYERVPSKSNPSDLPSRGALAEAVERFAVLDKGDVAISEHVLSMLVSKSYDPRLANVIAKAVRCEADMVSDLYQ